MVQKEHNSEANVTTCKIQQELHLASMPSDRQKTASKHELLHTL